MFSSWQLDSDLYDVLVKLETTDTTRLVSIDMTALVITLYKEKEFKNSELLFIFLIIPRVNIYLKYFCNYVARAKLCNPDLFKSLRFVCKNIETLSTFDLITKNVYSPEYFQ